MPITFNTTLTISELEHELERHEPEDDVHKQDPKPIILKIKRKGGKKKRRTKKKQSKKSPSVSTIIISSLIDKYAEGDILNNVPRGALIQTFLDLVDHKLRV